VTDLLTDMLRGQLDFQRTLGKDFVVMTTAERITWVKEMYVAAVQELGEALDETSWKSWATGERFDADALVRELCDAFQFMMNMIFASYPDASPDELARTLYSVHARKLAVNHRRHEENYDAVSSKCPGCRRDRDEVTVTEVRQDDGRTVVVLCVCGTPLGRVDAVVADRS
jgi:dUTPase